jgi:hypothetical protein
VPAREHGCLRRHGKEGARVAKAVGESRPGRTPDRPDRGPPAITWWTTSGPGRNLDALAEMSDRENLAGCDRGVSGELIEADLSSREFDVQDIHRR